MVLGDSGTPAEWAPGSVVVVRDEEWLVESCRQSTDGLLVHVRGLGPLVRGTTAGFYASLDHIEPLDPAAAGVVADGSPGYRDARLWLESAYRRTALPLGDRSLPVATRALVTPLAYQHSAVRRALDPARPSPRLLLADAVGLGKTIEIGMILAELIRRGRGDRILIVTPRHVLDQTQRELWSRFALPFVRLDAAGIQRVRRRLPAGRHPFAFFRRAIISIDTLKSDRYAAVLRKQRWDVVVIDEAHHLTNASTRNNKLARILARNTDSLILASATPHNGRPESFAELIRLLDESAVASDGTLVAAEVERLVIRRHRHSPEVAAAVGADWAERREPENVLVPAGPAEDAVARELEDVWLWPPGRTPYAGKLFAWTLAKAFLSSPDALDETIRLRLGRPGDEGERDALRRLRKLNDAAIGEGSAKYDCLVERLRRLSGQRVVVFAERVATLAWLRARLPADLGLPGAAIEVMHGGLPDDEQQRIVEAFRSAGSPVRILVTGDVAAEGVNLHARCHELIHFDIPWSLIRLEQRNGRIDRYGQRFPPRITALLLTPSGERFAGDVRILARLVEKEHEAHRVLGDAGSLMGRYDVRGEEDQIRAVLAGERTLDEIIGPPPESRGTAPIEAADPVTDAVSGLYPDEMSYLDEALHAAFADPAAPLSGHGVGWRRNPGTAELTPPPDLAQRLDIVPRSHDHLVLATTTDRGPAAGDEPDRHYLSPLHPVLEWAADRALAGAGRNEVYAVHGDVAAPTVLLLGTESDQRGRLKDVGWLTADPAITRHRSAAAAFAVLSRPATPRPVRDAAALSALIGPAVAAAREHLPEVRPLLVVVPW